MLIWTTNTALNFIILFVHVGIADADKSQWQQNNLFSFRNDK